MADGPLGGAVTEGRQAGGLFHAFARPRKVVPELSRGHLVHPAVEISMDGDLVAPPCRPAIQPRKKTVARWPPRSRRSSSARKVFSILGTKLPHRLGSE